MTNMVIRGFKEPVLAVLAVLMIFFPVSVISLRNFSVLGPAGVGPAGLERAATSAMIWK